MNRLIMSMLGGGAVLAVAACGSAAAGTSTASPSPSAGRGFARNAAAGQLVQINGATLIVSNANGDVTVMYTSATTITQQRTGNVANIVAGTCIVATGQRDAAGALTASTVRLSNAVNGSCSRGFTRPNRTPNPSASPRPGGNLAVVAGQVATGGVNGTSVNVVEANGSTVTITVPTTVRVTIASAVPASTLSVGQCVAAVGPKGSTGAVQARSLTIVPAGLSGCFTGGGGFGGPGGFGGGGFGGL